MPEDDSSMPEDDAAVPEQGHPEPTGGGAAPVRPTRALPPANPWAMLWHDLVRPGWGQVAVGIVLALLGAAIVVQVHGRATDDAYSTMRRSDLVQLLDQLNSEQARLSEEAARLERTRDQLASGADARRVAAAENQKRLQNMGILAGTLPAVGPGVRLTIIDPQQKVTAAILLDAVEEMRDAGAEAMQLNGTVRVVGSTWFAQDGTNVVVDGAPLRAPYTLEVIGEPHALEEGARFRGGLVSQVQAEAVGGQVLISRLQQVQVSALHTAATPQWARPA